MKSKDRIAVCSRSFSKNTTLRQELFSLYENVTFNDDGIKLEGDSLVDFLKGHDKAIVALERIDDDILSRLPGLKVISKYGVGLDMIDIDAIHNYGKRLGWVGGVNRRSVSELVISFAIAILRHIPAANREVVNGIWRQHVGSYLSNRTVGIIGCGFVGKDLVKLLQPFNCKILVNDIRKDADFCTEFNIQYVDLDTLLSNSDVVTIHLPLDNSTRNMLNKEKLSLLKSESILINTARGGIVDEYALKEMLKNGSLLAAAFDVFNVEPPPDKELILLPNFLVTPHIGGSANEAILSMGRAAISGLNI